MQPGADFATTGARAPVISLPKILADLNSSKSWIRISVKYLGFANSIRTFGPVPAYEDDFPFEADPAKALMATVEARGTSKVRHRLKVFIVRKISTQKAGAHPVFMQPSRAREATE